MKKLLLAAVAAIALLGPAQADYNITTPITAPPNTILQVVKSGVAPGGSLINYMSPIDATGIAFGNVSNPFAIQFGSGVTLPAFASPPSVSITGTLPNFASVQHFICDSGCSGGGGGGGGTSSNFNSAFPAAGTAIGVSSGGNMVALGLGQQVASLSLPVVLTAAQLTTLTPPSSVGITGSVAVTGTFFQATQPISAASLPLPTGAATQTTLASILAALGSPFQAGGSVGISGTLPSFASTQHFICDSGCTGGGASGGGTSSNFASAFPAVGTALGVSSGGNMVALTLGQQLAASSIPVVLTAAQITTLTPPTTLTVTQSTASSLNATVVGTGTFAVQAAQSGTWVLGAGAAIIGNVGIDQTTPASTNGVSLVPNSSATGAITPTPSTTAESSHVLKGSAGSVYSAAATNQTATAGWLVLINATTAPADGAITPLACAPLPANGSASIGYGDFPAAFSNGIISVVSSGANCFTKTTGIITAFLSGQVK